MVCDHPPGLRDEPAKPDSVTPLATSSPFSLAASSILREATAFPPAVTGSFSLHEFRGANHEQRQEAAAVLGGTVSFHVKATGKDESSMWRQLTKKKLEDLWRSRDHWRTRAEESNASKTRRQRGFLPKTKGMRFEQEFKPKISWVISPQ